MARVCIWRERNWPTRPSMRSRSRSACPLWRAYSSIMCTSSSRSETGSPSESLPTKPRSWSRVNRSAKAISSRHASCASATTAGSATAPLKSASGSASVWYRLGTSSPANRRRNQPVPPRPCAGPGRAATWWRVPQPSAPVAGHPARRTSAAASAAGSAGTRSASPAHHRAAGRLRAGQSRDRGTGPPGAVAWSRPPRLLLDSPRPTGWRDAKCRAPTVSEHGPAVRYRSMPTLSR